MITPVLPAELCDSDRIAETMLVNPTGRFVVGGPVGDAGLTGRKIIVDTYGGMGRHGGGAFSGKDPSKVDRSAAYAARHVAKNVVAAGLAERCEVQVAYAIGVAHPVSLMVETFGTGKLPDAEISRLVEAEFDMRPGAFRQYLRLHRPIYQKTAAYGHFGREDADFTWEDRSGRGPARGRRGRQPFRRAPRWRRDLEAHAGVAEAVHLLGAERRGEVISRRARRHAVFGEQQPGLADHLRSGQVTRLAVGVEVDADVVTADRAGMTAIVQDQSSRRSPWGPRPELGRRLRRKPAIRARAAGLRLGAGLGRALGAAQGGGRRVAQRQGRGAAGDRDALAVAAGVELAAVLGGRKRRGAMDDGGVDEGARRHRGDHLALRAEARGDRDRADVADPLGEIGVDDQRGGVGEHRGAIVGEHLGDALQGAAGDAVAEADPSVGGGSSASTSA